MKSIVSALAAIVLLATGTINGQAASRNTSENGTTAQLNQQQVQSNGNTPQSAAAPSPAAPMPAPQAGTTVNGKYIPPGARCGSDNPSCAQQIQNPAVNSPSQLRLQGAQ